MSALAIRGSGAEKRQRALLTPEGIALPLTVGSRGARAGALAIDFFIIIATMIVTTLLAVWFFTQLAQTGIDEQGPAQALIVVWIIAMFLFRNAYFLFFELGPRGATPGKRVTGLRVAARNGGRLTVEAVVARNLLRDIELFFPLTFINMASAGEGGKAALAAAIWFAIFLLFPFFNKDALRAGDVIAGTWVVEAPRRKLEDALDTSREALEGRSTVTEARYTFSEEELAHYGEYELQTLESVLRQGNPEALAAVQATICGKIGWEPGAGDERAFLEAYYAQLRQRLEKGMRFGQRKADKFS